MDVLLHCLTFFELSDSGEHGGDALLSLLAPRSVGQVFSWSCSYTDDKGTRVVAPATCVLSVFSLKRGILEMSQQLGSRLTSMELQHPPWQQYRIRKAEILAEKLKNIKDISG